MLLLWEIQCLYSGFPFLAISRSSLEAISLGCHLKYPYSFLCSFLPVRFFDCCFSICFLSYVCWFCYCSQSFSLHFLFFFYFWLFFKSLNCYIHAIIHFSHSSSFLFPCLCHLSGVSPCASICSMINMPKFLSNSRMLDIKESWYYLFRLVSFSNSSQQNHFSLLSINCQIYKNDKNYPIS